MVKIEDLVMRLTGTNKFGDAQYTPPEPKNFRYRIANNKVIVPDDLDTPPRGEYQVFASNNDGFELWMGWGNQWKYHLNQSEVRALFWWILWEWYGRSRWFGLRRPIYYWALRRHVAQFRKVSK